jgi:hypothetical protein
VKPCPHGIWYRVEEEAVEFSTKADELKGGKVSATEVTGKFLYFPSLFVDRSDNGALDCFLQVLTVLSCCASSPERTDLSPETADPDPTAPTARDALVRSAIKLVPITGQLQFSYFTMMGDASCTA